MKTPKEIIEEFWKHFESMAFVREMNSYAETEEGGMVKELNPVIEDREETILIQGEFDKSGVDDYLIGIFKSLLQSNIEELEGMTKGDGKPHNDTREIHEAVVWQEGYNQALDTIIQKKQQQLKELSK